jgi:hypothetical protein
MTSSFQSASRSIVTIPGLCRGWSAAMSSSGTSTLTNSPSPGPCSVYSPSLSWDSTFSAVSCPATAPSA